MDNVWKKVLLKAPVQTPHEIQQAIQDVCTQLDRVQSGFEMETDSDLIEAYIYQMESLRARYRYLLRQAKGMGLTSAKVPLFAEREASS